MVQPLLMLRGVCRDFPAGEQSVRVLDHIDLSIAAGEMVAIVGASGSGKSTLMNILGCLDRPSEGAYCVAGQDTAGMTPDALARLRREHFGFIFQRYHLLSDLSARGNVEMPAVYAGVPGAARQQRATALLSRLGLEGRLTYRPGQLSGGQQQRVSIARALMNGGDVILADEPTGALDTQSGREVMRILQELHAEGHTIILVTHDMAVARHAQRVIEISDGRIVVDSAQAAQDAATPMAPTEQAAPATQRSSAAQAAQTASGIQDATVRPAADPAPTALMPSMQGSQLAAEPPAAPAATDAARPVLPGADTWRAGLDRLREALQMALRAMNAHRLRTFLTMLGIMIGIAAVVFVVALGTGAREQILAQISSMGTNTLDILPGKGFGDEQAGRVQTLSVLDAQALMQQPYLDSVTPSVSTSASLRHRNVSATGTINGVGEQFFRVRGYTIASGQAFDAQSVRRQSQDVVIDPNARDALFGPGVDPIGQVILLGTLPARVIGVTQAVKSAFGNSDSLNVWLPYTTVMYRMLGQPYLRSITVRVADDVPASQAEARVTELLTTRHGTQDFFIINTDTIRQTIEGTTATMTLLVSAIALISLVVGGIGVMNIMLVSVTERTREIGVRMAVGARQSDIMIQFLIESVLVCLIGGALGIALALAVGEAAMRVSAEVAMIYSTASMVLAFACSTLIGVAFGFLPARNAARLDPVDALSRD